MFLYHVTESFLYRQKNNTVAKLHFGSILMAFYIRNSFPLLDILLQVRLQVFTRISASFDRLWFENLIFCLRLVKGAVLTGV